MNIKLLLGTIAIILSSSLNAQQISTNKEYRHHVSLQPFYTTEIGLGLGASYQYFVAPKISISVPAGFNLNLSAMMYGPAITHVYKSTMVRLMPNVKYYPVNTYRFQYGLGPGLSYGRGWDYQVDVNYKGAFNQFGAFVDNNVAFFTQKEFFGIGADLALGYHFYDDISPQYSRQYENFLFRFSIKMIARF